MKRKNKLTKGLASKMMSALMSFVLVFTAFGNFQTIHATIDGDGSDIINEAYDNGQSLQPVAPAFRVKTLLEWKPGLNPDDALNQSTIPLNLDRFKGHQVNALANVNAKVTSAAISNANHDLSPSTGGSDFNIYAFDNWQYLDSMIYWASSDEGVIAVPSPDITDAAHKNGVPVYATLHFPWGSGHHDSLEELERFSAKNEDGTYPVADKMIEIAQYYGFDGYFFNQESFGSNADVSVSTQEMLRYLRAKSREVGYPIYIGWYDAMANSGSVSHQDAVNSNNDIWMKHNDSIGDYAADEFFMNFNWTKDKIRSTHSFMKDTLNRDPFDAYAGFEVQQNSYKTKIRRDQLVDDAGKALSSIALYAPNSTMGIAKDAEDYHNQENIFYTGPQGDPTLADDSADWSGIARFVADKSVIKGNEFVTHFNTGHGKQWFADGAIVRNTSWNSRSVQDIMPTWRFWIKDPVGTRATVAYDFDDAFNGGNSLKISGDLDANSKNNIMLYSTQLDVQADTSVRLVLKGNAKVSLGVSFEEDYMTNDLTMIPLTLVGEGWNDLKVDLSEFAGKTVRAISLQVENEAAQSVSVNLGMLAFLSGEASVSAVTNVKIDEFILHHSREAQARLSWDKVENTSHYEVYQVDDKGVEVLLGSTPNTTLYAEKITRIDESAALDDTTVIRVKAISKSGLRSAGSDATFAWGLPLSASEKDEQKASINVALNAQITAISAENDAEPGSKALDGTHTGNSKWTATNKRSGFMDIKLDEAKTVQRWRVEHAEYGGEAQNMNTVDFSLQYKDDSGAWQIAKEIKGNGLAVTDVLLDTPITASEWKLKIDNAGTSPWQAIRIYEWQMFETGLLKADNINLNLVKADKELKTVELKHVPQFAIVKLYDKLNSSEAFKEVTNENEGTVLINDVDFDALGDRVFYTLSYPWSLESIKNSVLTGNESKEMGSAYIHVYSNEGMGLNATFDVTDSKGTTQSLGGTSDSGITVALAPGTYTLELTSIPLGFEKEDSYSFVVNSLKETEVVVNVTVIEEYNTLGKMIYDYKKVVHGDYTDTSFESFKSSLLKAEQVHTSASSLRVDYTDASASLSAAHENLQTKLQEAQSVLEKLLETGSLVKGEDYSSESYSAFKTAMDEAQIILNDPSSTLEAIVDVTTTLKQALENLESIVEVDKTGLIDKHAILNALVAVQPNSSDTEEAKALLVALEAAIANVGLTELERDALLARAIDIIQSMEEAQVNLDTLRGLLSDLESIDAKTLTETSVSKRNELIGKIELLISNENASQAEINTLVEEILLEMPLFEYLPPVSQESIKSLESKLSDAKSLVKTDYTSDSFAVLETAIEQADRVLNGLPANVLARMMRTVDQSMVDEAISSLDAAVKQLVVVEVEPGTPTPEKPVVETPEQPKPENPGTDKPEPELPTTENPKTPEVNKPISKGDLPATGIGMNPIIITGLSVSGLGLLLLYLNKRRKA